MYFSNEDACDMSVMWHLQREHPKEWGVVVSVLHALTADPESVEDMGRFEGALLDAISEVVWYNSDEEPTGTEYDPCTSVDPDAWQWAREDEMLRAMGYSA